MKFRIAPSVWSTLLACLLLGGISSEVVAEDVPIRTIANSKITALFNETGLVTIKDLATDKAVSFKSDSASITVGDQTIDTASLTPTIKRSENALTYAYTSNGWNLTVVYELKPDWGFVSKQLILSGPDAAYRVNTVNMLNGELIGRIEEEHKINRGSYGVFLRFGEEGKPSYGMLFVIQNPFNKWSYEGRTVETSYAADMDWKSEWGPFKSDRLILAPYTLSGNTYPAKITSEWKYVQDPEAAYTNTAEKRDMAEIEAYQGAVAAFTEFSIKKSVRIDVGWCENDYQIDVGAPEGRTEYKRIIDRTADLGGEYILYAPANNQVSKQEDSRDAWGWESLLWFGMGQKIRRDEWDPAKDPVPACIQEMLDYAKSKNIKLVAYAYPTLGWMQDLAWTAWCDNKPQNYSGADTGIRSFQDWFVKKLVDFQKKTGAGGFAFDHWWIDYGSNKEAKVSATSKYAQWYGCRRIISELRKAVPDIVVDGRQQYHWFGPWTWVGGSYPHPFGGDEQPGSFRARADLHTDRLSANHIRWVNWRYRMENFCPPEMVPGYMTHQTQRSDAAGKMHRDPWRRADWDLLGWKYSVISSIATAPLNHVLNFLPARDIAEFNAFSKADQLWWKNWMNWTDKNIDILRNYRFIAPPMVGRTDGTAAFKDDKGFVFLFNANYRKMNADFTLDSSIGLFKGKSFIIKQLYPIEKLIGKPGEGIWKIGDKVSLPMDGAGAVVLSVEPASDIKEPILFNSPGKATLKNGSLDLSGVSGEVGTSSDLVVAVPAGQTIKSVKVNSQKVKFTQNGNAISTSVKFSGAPFSQCQQIGKYDPKFSASVFKGEFTIPSRIFAQLAARKKAWPVPYTEDDLIAPWIGPERLLLFVNIPDANPKKMDVTIKINGQPIAVKKAFNGIYGGDQTFIGFYADVASLKADTKYQVEIGLPTLEAGQFQGLYFDNVETEYTKVIGK
ncbi:MAG: hypothetical protein NT018_03345 [Armatimonadetes bacterium]|nr:hypothetical protein [Armatimonadota bacterium]